MNLIENITNFILMKYGDVLEQGGIEALLKEPPLRVFMAGSFERGSSLFRALTEDEYISKWFGLVGVATDDPEKYPSLAKNRIWQYPEVYAKRMLVPDLVKERNEKLPEGRKIPIFTDRIKLRGQQELTPEFEAFLNSMKADIALMGTFGQLITQPIIDKFEIGFCNFHPTGNPELWPHPDDVGPQPFEAIIGRGCENAYLAMHWVSAKFDDGPMVWFSDPVKVPPNAAPLMMHELTSPTVRGLLRGLIQFGVEARLEMAIRMSREMGRPLYRPAPDRPPWNASTATCASPSIYAHMHHVGN